MIRVIAARAKNSSIAMGNYNQDVVIGIVLNDNREILIAKRPSHVVEPNVWEFPGGKIESGETAEAALIRELKEEIGIAVKEMKFLLRVSHCTGQKNLHLQAFLITQFECDPIGQEGQEIRWESIGALDQYTFPKANAGIIKMIQKIFIL